MFEHWFHFRVRVKAPGVTREPKYLRVRAEHVGEAMAHLRDEKIYRRVEWVPAAEVLEVELEYTLGEGDQENWRKEARVAYLN